jgi:hypothetical protein
MAIAVVTDTLQLSLGPLGWIWIDQGLDVVAMVLTCATLGFHMLLLPTFVVELFPLVDALPTWTACTAAVIMLRKRAEQHTAAPPKTPSSEPPPIDVSAEVTQLPPRL